MSNQKILKNYLLGTDEKEGYLKSDLSNGKVIMLSGKWGSGKTHFWKNIIATNELKKELKDKREVYSYISLYGKTSIEEIENDIFSQAYSDAIGGGNFITKGFSTFTKRMKRFGSSKIAKGLKEEQKDNIERTALSRLNNGGVICLDDFERKSKDIDLNDLFGFITQLTLNFKCKVVIILNEDVFEGKEKEIFSNVKEKSVSKFLYFNPSIDELFNTIFNTKEEYSILNGYKDLILRSFEKTKLLNARFYNQILDNLCEWCTYNKSSNDEVWYFTLVNINFIKYHTKLCIVELRIYDVPKDYNLIPVHQMFDYYVESNIKTSFDSLEFINRLKEDISSTNAVENSSYYEEIINENLNVYKSIFFMNKYISSIKEDINDDKRSKIHSFIETGILD